MKIIDAQVHIWSQTVVPPSGLHRKVEKFTAEDVLKEMDEAGVDAALIHPPSWDPNSHALAVEAVRTHPDKLAILGYLPPDQPASRAQMDSWKSQPGVLGLRYALVRPEQQTWHADGTMDWLWPAAERAGVPIALMASRFFPLVGQIAERHPRLRLIIDHLGHMLGGMNDAAFGKNAELCALARYPNIAVKATGAPGYSTASYPYRNIHDHMHRIFDAFGPDRYFWGTDITRMPCTYRQCVTMFTEELPWLAGHDLDRVMGQALCDWIGWRTAA